MPFLGYSMDEELHLPLLISPWVECSNVLDYLTEHSDADVVNIVSIYVHILINSVGL